MGRRLCDECGLAKKLLRERKCVERLRALAMELDAAYW